MSWRYQPVFTEQNGERFYALCQVYFDAAGNLEGWTENGAVAPGGADRKELSGELVQMLMDSYNWKPVRFADLKPGFVFVKAISTETRRAIADYMERSTEAFERAPRPQNN